MKRDDMTRAERIAAALNILDMLTIETKKISQQAEYISGRLVEEQEAVIRIFNEEGNSNDGKHKI